MAIPSKLKNWLDKNKVKYEPLAHKTVYTAFDLARTARAKLQDVAKTLLVKVDSKYVMVVIPAHYKLDMQKLKKALKVKKAELTKEPLMKKLLKVKPGSMTAFTALYPALEKLALKVKEGSKHAPVYVDQALLKSKKILVRAGTFEDSLLLKAQDFVKAVDGMKGNYSTRDAAKKFTNTVKKVQKKGKKVIKKKAKK